MKTPEEWADEIKPLLEKAFWQGDITARDAVASHIQSALAERTEQCAKICDAAKDEVEGMVAPEVVHWISPIADPLKYCAKQIRALNQPEKR